MAKNYVIEFVVQSKFKNGSSFPMDMLRYDRCIPYDSSDVNRITDSLHIFSDKEKERYPIHLIHYSHGNKNWQPTYERWNSFSYTVIEVKPAREF